jgi:hypothetical protein
MRPDDALDLDHKDGSGVGCRCDGGRADVITAL